jgi:hypothetical protein
VVGLLFEDLLTGSLGVFFLCHICCCVLCAKLVTIFDICNFFIDYFYLLYTFIHYSNKFLVFRCLIDV